MKFFLLVLELYLIFLFLLEDTMHEDTVYNSDLCYGEDPFASNCYLIILSPCYVVFPLYGFHLDCMKISIHEFKVRSVIFRKLNRKKCTHWLLLTVGCLYRSSFFFKFGLCLLSSFCCMLTYYHIVCLNASFLYILINRSFVIQASCQ